uniref:Interleukin n=1 Tax=Poecilia mexicana TaxID=48701 RepID=A0A3B3YNC2_9TELE
MEHFMRIGFWIFTLSVTLSDCHPVSDCRQPNHISDYNFVFMRNLTCEEDGTFYTPESVDEKCYKSALECIYKELEGTAQKECHDPDDRIQQGLEALKFKIKKMTDNTAPPNPSACACEAWPQMSFTKFLEKYESLLEKENAAKAASCR